MSTTFRLVKKDSREIPIGRNKTKSEDVYTYQCNELGATICFHSHPTRAFHYVLLPESNELGAKVFYDFVEAFVSTAIDHTKTFDEAIQQVTVP